MRIKKLTIKNLGKHKSLVANMDGAVTGIVGANGSGKSTILKIIHLLMTGATPPRETQDSYVRKVDPALEAEPTYGTAEMEFTAQGAECKLWRRVGSSPGRRLEIGTRVLTRAEDIQTALTDIMGADKYAIDNAVFPAQGELDKLLFGQQAEREELLVKLLLLGHMQKVADVAAGKVRILNSELQDFSVLQDELMSGRRSAEEQLAVLDDQLMKSNNYNVEIQQYTTYKNITDELIQLGHLTRGKTAAATAYSTELDRLLEDKATELHIQLANVEDLRGWVTKLDKKIVEMQRESSELLTLKNNTSAYLDTKRRLSDTTARINAAYTVLPDRPSNELIQQLIARLKTARSRAEAVQKIADTTELLNNLRSEKITIDAELNEHTDKLATLQDVLAVHVREAALLNTIVQTCTMALSAHTCSDNCPVCGTTLAGMDLQARLDNTNIELQSNIEKQAGVSVIVATRTRAITKCTSRLSVLNADIPVKEQEVKQAESIVLSNPYEDADSIDEEIRNATLVTNKYYEVLGQIGTLETERDVLNAKLTEYANTHDTAKYENIVVADVDNNIQVYQANITRWIPILDSLRESLGKADRINTQIESARLDIQEYTIKSNALKVTQSQLEKTFTPRLLSMISSGYEDIVAELNNKNVAYIELRAKANQVRAHADDMRVRLIEIDKKVQLDADKRDVISDLQRIIAAFSRQGIPMAYVQHKFDSLVAIAQANLEIMDANFAIIPHANKPVSMQFYRVDEPGQVLFDQDKLSGGQRVRLTIAFLLAVQQLVIPDLGFLVLDEPSMHLDEAAKENLKELLLNMGRQLESTDMQILVCDHAPELEPALKKCIKL